jgi:hypothetical protein
MAVLNHLLQISLIKIFLTLCFCQFETLTINLISDFIRHPIFGEIQII